MSVGGGAVAVWRLAGMDRLTRPAENFEVSLFVPTPPPQSHSDKFGFWWSWPSRILILALSSTWALLPPVQLEFPLSYTFCFGTPRKDNRLSCNAWVLRGCGGLVIISSSLCRGDVPAGVCARGASRPAQFWSLVTTAGLRSSMTRAKKMH